MVVGFDVTDIYIVSFIRGFFKYIVENDTNERDTRYKYIIRFLKFQTHCKYILHNITL